MSGAAKRAAMKGRPFSSFCKGLAECRRSHTALPRRAGCTQKSKESMAVRAQCLGGHIALPRRATERRPVVSTQAKRVWPSGHRTQGAILAGCMTKGLPKGRPFVFGLVLLPSAGPA